MEQDFKAFGWLNTILLSAKASTRTSGKPARIVCSSASLATHCSCQRCLITLGNVLICVFEAYPIWNSGPIHFSSSLFLVLAGISVRKLQIEKVPSATLSLDQVRYLPLSGHGDHVDLSFKHFCLFSGQYRVPGI